MMECPVCNNDNEPDARFCTDCGAPLAGECPRCSNPVRPDQNFCAYCGLDLRREAAGPTAASPLAYTPPHLAQRILDQRHLVVGERKHVTVLFADLVGSTAAIEGTDPEEAASYLTTALGAMMDAVHRYEGTVNELRGDGIMALFGAPLAHEDHAVRACRAGLEIAGAVGAATNGASATRVGIHSGEVLVRGVGNDLSVEYQALGPTVHLAARLEGMAEPGTVLVSDAVRHLVEGALELRTEGPRPMKGFSEPQEVFSVAGVVTATPWETRASRGLTAFVGRERELGRLTLALADTSSDRGRVVEIVGRAGVGKSRLVHEFLASPQVAGSRVLKAEATALDSTTAYYPVARLIEAWLGTDEADGDATMERGLRQVDQALVEAAPPLAALLEPGYADPAWTRLSPDDRKVATRRAVRAWVRTLAASRLLVLVIEDLHWIDGETQAVLDDLADVAAGVPLLLLVTHRPEYEGRWTGQAHVERLPIPSLAAPSTQELVDSLLGADPSLADLKPVIAARGGGTPLFLEEIVRALVDSGTITGAPGAYVASGDVEDVRIPDSVQAVLAARIDRLDPGDKHLLQIAAVAGTTVEVPLLAAVAGRSETDVAVPLARLQDREFLYESRVLPTAEFRFGHDLIRDVAYGSLPLAERTRLHAAIVTAIEDGEPDEADRPIERLAVHAVRGKLGERAVRYAIAAAGRAIERSAYREAASFTRDAVDTLATLPRDRTAIQTEIDLRMMMRVTATGATGSLTRSAADLAEAQRLAESIDDTERQGRIAIHLGYVANMLGDAALAEAQSGVAGAVAEQTGDRHLGIEARILLAQIHNYAGRPNRVAPAIREDFPYLTTELRHETLGQTMIRSVVAGAHLAMSASAMGDFTESIVYEREAAAIAGETGRPFDLMYMQWVAGVRLDYQGEAAAAVAAHRRSVDIAEEHDIWFMTTFAQPWLGHALLRDGRPDEALELLSRIEADAHRAELPYVAALSRAFSVQAAQRLGDGAAARRHAEAALAFHETFPTPLIELVARTGLGLLDPGSDGGRQHLGAAAAIAAANGFGPWRTELLQALDGAPGSEEDLA